MGAGGMLGIMGIIALVAWGIVRLIRNNKKVVPETPGLIQYSGKSKVAPFTTTGIEDLETKVPSEDNKRNIRATGGVL
jgi:hypothetical protein